VRKLIRYSAVAAMILLIIVALPVFLISFVFAFHILVLWCVAGWDEAIEVHTPEEFPYADEEPEVAQDIRARN